MNKITIKEYHKIKNLKYDVIIFDKEINSKRGLWSGGMSLVNAMNEVEKASRNGKIVVVLNEEQSNLIKQKSHYGYFTHEQLMKWLSE